MTNYLIDICHLDNTDRIISKTHQLFFKTTAKKDLEVLICEDSKEALELKAVASYFDEDVLVFPDFRAGFGDDLRSFKEELHQLFTKLQTYYISKKKPLIISPLKTLLFNLPNEQLLESTSLEFGSKIDLKSFKEKCCFGVITL